MRTVRVILAIVAALFVTSALVTDAQAQATRTWVSGVGDDANPCSRTAPCKTFAGAISKTAAAGEISVLDPGGFGAVTITKSITINGEGTLAGILASLVNGVIVNAGVNDKIILRNISINGAGNGLNAIRFLAGGQLTVENVAIYGFTQNCIDVSKTAAGELVVINTTMTNCNNGIRLATTAGQLLATIDRTSITNMTSIGVEVATGDSRASITNSDISSNGTDGVKVGSATAGAQANVTHSLIGFNSGNGINAATSGRIIRIGNNTITNNTTGVSITAGATVASTGNNRIDGNGGTTAPNGTFIQQ